MRYKRSMITARQDPTRFLYLEKQFCSLCRAAGRPGVRVFDLSTDRPIIRGFRLRRRNAALRHLKTEHPAQYEGTA